MDTEHFDVDLQGKMLALMVQNKSFLARIQTFMQPYYFDTEIYVDLVRLVKDYYSNYGTNPTPLSLMVETKNFLEGNKRKNTEKYFETITECFEDKLPEQAFLEHEAFNFVQFQEVRNALFESAELLETRKLEQIKKKMMKAFAISEVNKPVKKYFAPEVIRERWSHEEKITIATGWKELDRYLDDGGIGPGELGLVLGFSGIGKSIILMMLGANALRQRKKVLHISLENSKRKTEKRYDRNLFGKTKSLISDNPKLLEDFLIGIQTSHKCDLIVEHFPSYTLKPSELKAYILSLKLEDFEPDLVIVDSPYLMKPEFNRERKDIELGEIIMMLRGMGAELGIPIWGGAQTVASAEFKKKVGASDTGKSFEQYQDADLVIMINRTAEEKAEHVIRLVLGKNRDECDDITLRYKTNWDTMRFRYEPEGD